MNLTLNRIRISAVPYSFLGVLLLGFLTPSAWAQDPCCSEEGMRVADTYRVSGLGDRRFKHADLWESLAPYMDSDRIGVTPLGWSIEGRAIQAVTLGSGPITVLLWSQMHGDESTATMSLADIIRWWAESPDQDPLRRTLEERLTITTIPMLNPDGAERFIRHNAAGVDINRDARRLATPEGRILKAIRDSINADFGYNLHDQGSNTAGDGGELVAIALLAPAADEERTWGPVRQRARWLAATIVGALDPLISGRIAKYDDTFAPRAFGDNMQAWGTSTVLIESGAHPDDPQKQKLRKLNVVALLTSFHAIAGGLSEATPTDGYDDLPTNSWVQNDLLIVGGHLVLGEGDPMRLDLAIIYDDDHTRTTPRYGEIGDLEGEVALDTLDATGLYLHPARGDFEVVLRGEPAGLVARRGTDPESEALWAVGLPIP